jgi:hypothetical protein
LRSSQERDTWVERANARHDVFFRYSGKANKIAQDIKKFLVDES